MTDSTPPSNAELARQFELLNEHLAGGGDRTSALRRLVDLAVVTIAGCDWAGITEWPDGGEPHTLAWSDDVAREADRLQYEMGQGPCLTAAAGAEVVQVTDLRFEQRWLAFTQAVGAQTPIRSVASFHLAGPPARSALNLYSRTVDAFDDETINTSALFASRACVLLLHAGTSLKATHLTAALTTSRQIGVAIGILMNAHKITADRALELLRTSSQDLNRKLRDIAQEVTDTGTLPEARTRRTP